MARYIGPKTKISRKFGEPIFGADKSFEKKNYPPGQHGLNKRRQKKSEYAIQLMEKQKAKFLYGILPPLMVYKARYHEKSSSLYQLPGGKISLYFITLGAILVIIMQILLTQGLLTTP